MTCCCAENERLKKELFSLQLSTAPMDVYGELKAKYAELNDVFEESNRQYTELRQKHDRLAAAHDALYLDKLALDRENETLRREHEQFLSTEANNGKLRIENEKLEKKAAFLQQSVNDTAAMNRELQNKNDKLEKETETLRQRVASLEKDAANLREKDQITSDAWWRQAKSDAEKMSALQEENARLKVELMNERVRIADFQKCVTDQFTENGALSHRLNQIKALASVPDKSGSMRPEAGY